MRVDPDKRVARVGGGATWGMSTTRPTRSVWPRPAESSPPPGSAGLTLGGGIGYLTRSVGLSIDNLLSADVVLADGRQVTASDYQNEDLFWALRGGGGNFGVVTSFEFQLHEVGDVVAGPLFYDFDDATAVLECYRSFINEAPEQLGCFFGWQIAPPLPFIPEDRVGDLFCVLVTCWNGPHEEAEQVLRPLRDGRRGAGGAGRRDAVPGHARAPSTISSRRACRTTGKRTSPPNSPTRRSPLTSSTARRRPT